MSRNIESLDIRSMKSWARGQVTDLLRALAIVSNAKKHIFEFQKCIIWRILLLADQ